MNRALAILFAAIVASACTQGPSVETHRSDLLPIWYYETWPRGWRLDLFKVAHVEYAPEYTALRVFPFATRNTYRDAASERVRLREQFGVEYILPMWDRDTGDARRRFRLISLFGRDELSLFNRDVRHEALDDGGARDVDDWTLFWWVGDGNVFFRSRTVELAQADESGRSVAVDLGRWFWGWLFQFVEYRSTTPAEGSRVPSSHTFQVFRVANGYLLFLRDHAIDGVESDLRFLGAFEADWISFSVFRRRERVDPQSGDLATQFELLGPLVRYESAFDRSKLRVFPFFTVRKEGSRRTLEIFHWIPIPLGGEPDPGAEPAASPAR